MDKLMVTVFAESVAATEIRLRKVESGLMETFARSHQKLIIKWEQLQLATSFYHV